MRELPFYKIVFHTIITLKCIVCLVYDSAKGGIQMDIISYERVIQQLSFSEAIQVMKRCFAELQKEKFRKVSAM